ncbi:MAG: hypothetical protein JWL97_3580 [Gemmatimonadales bacterium]|nr:hypothetical protein [Streptosporangiaceae bacterium]MDB4872576.1 hypothetical protein [Gemmatimonadales bacterium]
MTHKRWQRSVPQQAEDLPVLADPEHEYLTLTEALMVTSVREALWFLVVAKRASAFRYLGGQRSGGVT